MPDTTDTPPRSDGFSLVELLVVVVVLGILAAVTVFVVRGASESGEERACTVDEQTLQKAADYYLAQNQVSVIPATGAGPDQFEQTLVDAQLLKSTSTYFDLAADGSITATGTPCP
ncbi:MAG TPA: prepilin-type N-terminal cleavage/methylation domain-containing protein [Ilumatobacteraceae bacterium]|nr:prepilin-type N-terminal cleavage/methylation domain-containing protein [Ilumatobacteraceae bacterium]